MPSSLAMCPASTGSHGLSMMCHSTGMDELPNVTAHLVVPAIGMGGLLYGLILAWVFDHPREKIPSFGFFLSTNVDAWPSICQDSRKAVVDDDLHFEIFLHSLTGVAWLVWISMGDSEDVDVVDTGFFGVFLTSKL